MAGQVGRYLPDISNAVVLERQLAAALGETAQELGHAECFDLDQRSEIYTILRTLKSETDAHGRLLGRWISATGGEA